MDMLKQRQAGLGWQTAKAEVERVFIVPSTVTCFSSSFPGKFILIIRGKYSNYHVRTCIATPFGGSGHIHHFEKVPWAPATKWLLWGWGLTQYGCCGKCGLTQNGSGSWRHLGLAEGRVTQHLGEPEPTHSSFVHILPTRATLWLRN